LTQPIHARRFWSWLLAGLLWWMGGIADLGLGAAPAQASLDNDRYDGNIFALYAGNGSLVPPQTSLAEGLARKEVVVMVFYLDDNSASKRFAPVVSELQRLWGNRIALLPLVTDPLHNRPVEAQVIRPFIGAVPFPRWWFSTSKERWCSITRAPSISRP